MKISVVIPTHNREKYILRAIKSVTSQTINYDIEIIIVDDGSTDNTKAVIEDYKLKMHNIDIIYKKNNTSVGGAKARNIGSEIASGKYIAFLDSDDEWLPHHLENSIKILLEKKVYGSFGSFKVLGRNKILEKKLTYNDNIKSIPNYIFEEGGDTRTSTFVFVKDKFDAIKFDSNLLKHQDWDLAIRFNKEYAMAIDPIITVIIHNDVNNRMSSKNNHSASKKFMQKHYFEFSETAKAKYYLNLCINTLRFEGKNDYFDTYLISARKYSKNLNITEKIKLGLLKLPGINVPKIYDFIQNLKG